MRKKRADGPARAVLFRHTLMLDIHRGATPLAGTDVRNDPIISILVADDQADITAALQLLLKPHGYRTSTASSPRDAIDAVRTQPFDLVLVDLNYARDTTSGIEGLQLVREIRRHDATLPIVVMTAWSTVALAVQAMREGAHDFVEKPWDNDRLLSVVRTQAELGRVSRRAAELEATLRLDLELAAQVQRQLFPQTPPVLATLDYCGGCVPARSIGGDYYDFVPLGPGSLGIAVGDVAGKGVAAALLMANLQALVRSRAPATGDDAGRLVSDLNYLLCASMPSNRFATFFYAVYDEHAATLTYVNAGHTPALLVRAGRVIELASTGPVIGMFAEATYAAAVTSFATGDLLAVYTDGITDALNATGEEFGDGRLRDLVGGFSSGDADMRHRAVFDALGRHMGETPAADDMTLVVARRLQR